MAQSLSAGKNAEVVSSEINHSGVMESRSLFLRADTDVGMCGHCFAGWFSIETRFLQRPDYPGRLSREMDGGK